MKGAWEQMYAGVSAPYAYGDETTYKLGEAWLADLDVEDWGCGLAWFKRCHRGKYTGIDGSKSDFCDVVADLTTFTSKTPGLFMRHVLEHNFEWESILKNAISSFDKRMALILFTDTSADKTEIIASSELAPGVRVPDLSLHLSTLMELLQPVFVECVTVPTRTQYGREHIFYLAK